jgi:glycosyltransferase involved in cell wall biosynthesis
MMQKSKVLYTGAFRFPDKDAAAFRVQGIAHLFAFTGFKVDFAGWESNENGEYPYIHQGSNCFPQDEFRIIRVNPVSRLFGFLFRGRKTAGWLIENRSEYSTVVVYNPPVFFSLFLVLFCRFLKIKLILDSTEWYESEHLPGGRFGLAAFENWLRMKLVYRLFSNTIVISEFLRDHFRKSNSILIPPLCPTTVAVYVERGAPKSGLRLIYAGEAGKKDKLLPIIRILPDLSKNLGIGVSMSIVGMTTEELIVLLEDGAIDYSNYQAYINCIGRVTREKVMSLYAESHFSVLFRDTKRYAFAGFPTKAMESMVNGCPLITNATGDLAYMLNTKNAIILDADSVGENLSPLIQDAIVPMCYSTMSSEARLTAKRYFEPAAYHDKFVSFLNALA